MLIVRLRYIALAALTCALGVQFATAEAPARDFKLANVAWTLPDGWTFKDVTQDAKAFGHFAIALAPTQDIHVTGFSAKSDLPASDRLNEMRQVLPRFLEDGVKDTKVSTSTLSGVPCSVLVAEGKFKGGRGGQVRLYVMESGGRLYHLEMRLYNNAHLDRAGEVNAARQGFRLIKGAKGKDKDEKFDELGGNRLADDDGEEGGDGDDGSAGEDGEDKWPAKGPKRVGQKLTFTGYNFEVDLKGTPFTWREPIDDLAKGHSGNSYRALVRMRAESKRVKKQEFEKNTPDKNIAVGTIFSYPLSRARDTEDTLRSSFLKEKLQREHGLGEIKASKTRVNTNVTVGSLKGRGGFLQLETSLRDGTELTFLYFEVQLQGWMYEFRFLLFGHTDRVKTFLPTIGRMLKNNVSFIDDRSFVAGPIVPPEGILTFSGSRGKFLGKERTLRAPGGISLEKPEEFSSLEFRGNQALRFAVEARSEDKQAYIYFDVHTFPHEMLTRQNMKLETLADKRIGEWRSGAGEKAKLSKSGKAPYLRNGGKVTRVKGKLQYRLETEIDGVPYLEEGVWGKEGQFVIWARVQYGGKDAKKKMKKHYRALTKGMKIK